MSGYMAPSHIFAAALLVVLQGKKVRCSSSQAKHKLFIGNIPKTLGEEDLRKSVSEFGPGVIAIELLKDLQNSSRNRGFAFIEYYNHACADYARQNMSKADFKLGDKSPTVSWADRTCKSGSSAEFSEVSEPENLLLDCKGNLKISDFGLSALQKSRSLLSTACGSPSYVAPELLNNKTYDGAAADIWACGLILFELRAGYLPFVDPNLLSVCTKILRAEYVCPRWFSPSHKKLISRILNPHPKKRNTVAEIMEDEWFQGYYKPAAGVYFQELNSTDDVQEVFDQRKESLEDEIVSDTRGFINAFQLIAMSSHLDLSTLFEEQDDKKNRVMLGSKYTITETIQKIEEAAICKSFS